MTRLILITFALALQLSSAFAEPLTTLSQGTYKIYGTCAKMHRFEIDEVSKCQSWVAIDASDPEYPKLIFPHGTGAWIFKAAEPNEASIMLPIAKYKITTVMDLDSKMEFKYDGECEVDRSQPSVHCTMWKDDERKKVSWEAYFVGNGTWVFSKTPK